ncbi:MAG: fumarate hydratase [Candidatus Margulisiibacteriota bacterium]
MREIPIKKITKIIKELCLEANTNLSPEVLTTLNKALAQEESKLGREILREIIRNAQIALREKLAICQDTGAVIVFAEVGQEVYFTGGSFVEAVNEGVSRAYHEGYFRKSMVSDPLRRKNTADNTPAIIHVEIVGGDKVRLWLMTKGGGAENRSALKMFRPTATKEEISNFIVEVAEKAGPDACPPFVIGVGIGGTFDYAPVLAKKALLRTTGKHHSETDTARWEKELLERINKLGIGPMGVGGKITALAVNIEKYPCHISSLPVAVNIDCHAHRVKTTII